MLYIYVTPGHAADRVTDKFIEKAAERSRNGKKSLIIVPEQTTVYTEKALLKATDAFINFNCEVMNFSRLPNRAFREIGSIESKSLSRGEQALLMYLSLSLSRNKLSLYKDHASSAAFAEKLLNRYEEFAFGGVGTEQLGSIIEKSNIEEGFGLISKLSELKMIYSVYETLEGELGVNKQNDMTRLAEALSEFDIFDSYALFIDGFYGLSAPETAILKQLILQGESVYISVICSKAALEDKTLHNGFFKKGEELINRLTSFCRDMDTEYKLVFAEDDMEERNEEKVFLSEHFSDFSAKCDIAPSFFEIRELKDPYEEMLFCAKEINRAVRRGDCRYSDIAVTFRNEEKYAPMCRMLFDKYSVPYFKTDKKPLTEYRVSKFLINAIKIASGDLRNSTVERFLKSKMTSLSEDEIFALTDYARAWNISGNKWLSDTGFTMNPGGLTERMTEEDELLLKFINEAREKAFGPIRELKDTIASMTLPEIIGYLPEFLMTSGAYDAVKQECNRLQEQKRFSEMTEETLSWNSLNDSLKNAFELLSDTEGARELDAKDDLVNIVTLSMTGISTGRIPSYNDRVTVGQSDFIRFKNIKYLFFVGMNTDVFPKKAMKDELFTDRETEALAMMMPEADIFRKDTSSEEDLIFHLTSSAPKNKLYMSYTVSGSSTAGRYIQDALRIFPCASAVKKSSRHTFETISCPEEAFERMLSDSVDERTRGGLYSYFSEQRSPSVSSSPDGIAPRSYAERMERAFHSDEFYKGRDILEDNPYKDGKVINISQTRFNTYRLCKYAYFLKYILKVQPPVKTDLKSSDVGNFIHNILERFFREIFENGEDICSFTRQMIRSRVEEYSDEFMEAITKGSGMTELMVRVKNILINSSVKVIDNIMRELRNSSFIPILFEYEIGSHKDGGSATETNGRLNFGGKADRIDMYRAKDGTYYIRVTDYKTSSKKFALTDIYNGLNLQLLIYLFALCRSGITIDGEVRNVSPAGVLYTTASAPMITAESKKESDTFSANVDKKMIRDGMLLNDKEILKAMEKSGEGIFIPVKLDEDGNPKDMKKVYPMEELFDLEKVIERIMRETSRQLRSGNIKPDPFCNHDISCKFCEFRNICKYEGNKYDKSRKKYFTPDDPRKIAEILAQMTEEEKETTV